MTDSIDFTILTSDTPSGFTDQLYQFSTFYKLGKSLGYNYRHSVFSSPRSAAGIYDFIGFNNYFTDRGLLCVNSSYSHVLDIGLDDSLIQSVGITSFIDLRAFIANQIDLVTGTGDKLVRLQLTGRRKFFDLVNHHIQNLDGLDLRNIYFEARIEDTHAPVFEPGKIRILVHIRQGDTAIINTPWGTHIPVIGHRYPKLREFHNFKDLGHAKYKVSVDDFYRATRMVISSFPRDSLSIVVSSDGFHRAFERIYNEGEASGISARQLSLLKRVEQEYQAKYLKFTNLNNTQCILGETEENLYRFIHASLSADLIVVGTQQRMMQKLLMNYHDPCNPPVVIRLNNMPLTKQANMASSNELYPKVISVNLNDESAFRSAFRKATQMIIKIQETT